MGVRLPPAPPGTPDQHPTKCLHRTEFTACSKRAANRLRHRAAILVYAIGAVIFLVQLYDYLQARPNVAFAISFTTLLTVPLLVALAVGERRRARGGAR